MDASEVGDGIALVSVVYLIVLLPWAFLYFHDFISERWRSLRNTRRNGLIHIIVVSVPMPVVIAYIVLQRRLSSPDNKEMYAAITALALSVYHLLRTIWGLHQLSKFRRWAVATAIAMERAAYHCDAQQTPPPPSSRRRSSSSFVANPPPMPPPPPSRRFAAFKTIAANLRWKKAKKITGNPQTPLPLPLTDSRPIHFIDRCRVHDSVLTAAKAEIVDSARRTAIERYIDGMKVNSSLIDNEFIGSSAPRIHPFTMMQSNPHDTFVRWAICYLAQYGTAWMNDSRTKPYGTGIWDDRRHALAVDVWATAALRMETSCKGYNISLDDTGAPTNNADQVSFLAPALWHQFLPSHSDQLFSKAALLRRCMLHGEGYAYGQPILSKDEPIPAHGMYKGLIKDALGDLPSKLYDVVDGITPDQLHWFGIFIWITQWNGCGKDNTRSLSSTDRSPSTPQDTSLTGPNVVNATHAPVRTLQDQLGLDENLTLNRCSFPFVRQRYGRYLWRNRSVLQISARIDNWLSIRIGHQFVKLFRQYDSYGRDSEAFRHAHLVNPVEAMTEVGQQARSERIYNFHRRLELNRLRYQLARLDVPLRHLDQGITFMGCAMETVRSFLAEDIYRHQHHSSTKSTEWKPALQFDVSESFPISQQLADCLRAIKKQGETRFDSTVQERLLWECQNGLVRMLDLELPRYTAESHAHSCPQLIMLTILSFSSLRLTRLDSDGEGISLGAKAHLLAHEGTVSEEHTDEHSHENRSSPHFKDGLMFHIDALAAPQIVCVEVEASASLRRARLKLVAGRGELMFRWQDWRDAFLGRLSGKAEWQRSHFMRNLQINRTTVPLTALFRQVEVGENPAIPLWEGWQPFRARIRKFELEHSSLIIIGPMNATEPTFTPGGSFDLDDVISLSEDNNIDSTVNRDENNQKAVVKRMDPAEATLISLYAQAPADALSDASMHIDSVLRLNSSLLDKNARNEITASDPNTDDDPIADATLASSPLGSNDNIQVEMVFSQPGQQQKVLLDRVNEQDAKAMAQLAGYLLEGRNSFRKDRQRALLLLERAVAIGKSVTTGYRFIKALFDTSPVSDDAVRRALATVELLWRDMPKRTHVVQTGNSKRRKWRDNKNSKEDRRLSKLVGLHLKVIDVRHRAEVMCDLGNKLSTYGTSRKNERLAIALYESAIIADCDVWAMVGLALKHADRDLVYAKRLYERATNEIFDIEDDAGRGFGIGKEVSEYVQVLSMNGDTRASKLLREP